MDKIDMTRKSAPDFQTSSNASKGNVIELFPTDRMKPPSIKGDHDAYQGPVNANELISIKALTNFVAHNNNVSEDLVRNVVLTEFKAPAIDNLQRADYERVIRFLVDMQLDITLLN